MTVFYDKFPQHFVYLGLWNENCRVEEDRMDLVFHFYS